MTDRTAAAQPSPRPSILAAGEISGWDAVTTAEQVRSGSVSAGEVLDAALTRAEALNPSLGALFTISGEHAREGLRRRADDDSPRPLHGVPTAIKDLSHLRGLPTTMGSRATGRHVSRATGPEVGHVLATGMISIGKTAAPEWGMNPSGEALGFPNVRNPWNPAHSTGGSSSGAAAAVAAGVLPIAHASDGGGSIRIPAACCGLIGLKPTFGRITPPKDMRGLPVKLVCDGVLTRTVADTRAFLLAAQQARGAGHARPLPDEPAAVRPLRIAVLTSAPHGVVDAEVIAATRRLADDLTALGHHVDEQPSLMPESLRDDFLLYWGALAQGIAAVGFADFGPGFSPRELEPWTRGLAAHARRRLHLLPGAVRRLRRYRDVEFPRLMTRYHAIVTPTTGTPAPALGWLRPDQPFEELLAKLDDFVPFTPPWNVSGAPAISVPAALSSSGLPIGVQIGAASGEDDLLLGLAAQLEVASGFNVPLGPPR